MSLVEHLQERLGLSHQHAPKAYDHLLADDLAIEHELPSLVEDSYEVFQGKRSMYLRSTRKDAREPDVGKICHCLDAVLQLGLESALSRFDGCICWNTGARSRPTQGRLVSCALCRDYDVEYCVRLGVRNMYAAKHEGMQLASGFHIEFWRHAADS